MGKAQGSAWSSQAGAAVFKSLHKRACTGLLNRIAHSLRERPCFSRLARDEEIAKKAWCHAGLKGGGIFEKTSASSLERGFIRIPLHSRTE